MIKFKPLEESLIDLEKYARNGNETEYQRESWIKGQHPSRESIEKNRNAHLGKHYSQKTEFTSERSKTIRADIIFPKQDTKIEKKMQGFLKELQISFIAHKRIRNIVHAYNCDLFIPSLNLVIECDGNYWHNYPIGTVIDHQRNREMRERGYKVLRIWEEEIRDLKLNGLREILIEVQNGG